MQSKSAALPAENMNYTPSSEKKSLFTFARYSIPSERHPERNEDSLIADQRHGLVAVFDGVGGSVAGEVASQIAAHVMKRGWQKALKNQPKDVQNNLGPYDDLDVPSMLEQLAIDAHKEIRLDSEKKAFGLAERSPWQDDQATTLAAAILIKQNETDAYVLTYAHVGDSRIYLLCANDSIKRLTNDDSILTELVKSDDIEEEEALYIDQATDANELSELEYICFQQRNGITQALGDAQSPEVHTGQAQLYPGDRLLLCTDGIHDNLTDVEIETTIRNS
ncbi:MAG TPA: protein phosphatase 2C domain-containing protein, partial [Ktedonobacteraceae bacterium]